MKFFYLLVFTFCFLLVSACDPAKPVSVSDKPVENRFPTSGKRLPPTKPLEQMSWKIIDGKDERLGEYKGKVLVLDFWATYCPPCIKAIPHLKELQAKYGEQGFQIIGLHVGGPEDEPNVPEFIQKHKVDYPIATPEDQLTYALLGDDNRIPQTLIFDREGKLVKQLVSYDDTIKKELDETIEKTVNGQ